MFGHEQRNTKRRGPTCTLPSEKKRRNRRSNTRRRSSEISLRYHISVIPPHRLTPSVEVRYRLSASTIDVTLSSNLELPSVFQINEESRNPEGSGTDHRSISQLPYLHKLHDLELIRESTPDVADLLQRSEEDGHMVEITELSDAAWIDHPHPSPVSRQQIYAEKCYSPDGTIYTDSKSCSPLYSTYHMGLSSCLVKA